MWRFLNCIAAARISEGPSRVLGSFSFTRLPASMAEFKRLTTEFSRSVLQDRDSLSQ
jgi:hypothetical protein